MPQILDSLRQSLCNRMGRPVIGLEQDGNHRMLELTACWMLSASDACRMDVMRAAILGAAGTPYHDQLFFFDVQLSPDHPANVPKVHFHAHGNRINPNLYVDGKARPNLPSQHANKVVQ